MEWTERKIRLASAQRTLRNIAEVLYTAEPRDEAMLRAALEIAQRESVVEAWAFVHGGGGVAFSMGASSER